MGLPLVLRVDVLTLAVSVTISPATILPNVTAPGFSDDP